MYEGHQGPYSQPGTGKVGNPYLPARTSPPVRQAWREVRQHELPSRPMSHRSSRQAPLCAEEIVKRAA
ncbi:hypothetical protein BHE74_00043815 [Ensete ventricosum]|nr:hypothetical protein BHE74_00043815 [Ensete ventricosum]